MKKLLIEVVLFALLVPMGLFAIDTHGPSEPTPAPVVSDTGGTHVFGDMFIGIGGSVNSGTYSDPAGGVLPYYGVGTFPNAFSTAMSGGSFDFVFGANVFWVMNADHTLWMGIGTTLTIPIGGASNDSFFTGGSLSGGAITSHTLSLDVPFLYDIDTEHHISIIVKPSLLGIWAFDYIFADNLFGIGFGVSAGPIFYLDKRNNFGIAVLGSFKYISASGTDYNSGDTLSFTGSTFSVSALFIFEIASDNTIDTSNNSGEE